MDDFFILSVWRKISGFSGCKMIHPTTHGNSCFLHFRRLQPVFGLSTLHFLLSFGVQRPILFERIQLSGSRFCSRVIFDIWDPKFLLLPTFPLGRDLMILAVVMSLHIFWSNGYMERILKEIWKGSWYGETSTPFVSEKHGSILQTTWATTSYTWNWNPYKWPKINGMTGVKFSPL